jgi:hypothetical protein
MGFRPEVPFASTILPQIHPGCPREDLKNPYTPPSYHGTDEAALLEAHFMSKVAHNAVDPQAAVEFRPDEVQMGEARRAGVTEGEGLMSLCAQKIGAGMCGEFFYDKVTRTVEARDVDCEVTSA